MKEYNSKQLKIKSIKSWKREIEELGIWDKRNHKILCPWVRGAHKYVWSSSLHRGKLRNAWIAELANIWGQLCFCVPPDRKPLWTKSYSSSARLSHRVGWLRTWSIYEPGKPTRLACGRVERRILPPEGNKMFLVRHLLPNTKDKRLKTTRYPNHNQRDPFRCLL